MEKREGRKKQGQESTDSRCQEEELSLDPGALSQAVDSQGRTRHLARAKELKHSVKQKVKV